MPARVRTCRAFRAGQWPGTLPVTNRPALRFGEANLDKPLFSPCQLAGACLSGAMTNLAEAHADEPRNANIDVCLNWLRAGVLDANDSIVSVAAPCRVATY